MKDYKIKPKVYVITINESWLNVLRKGKIG